MASLSQHCTDCRRELGRPYENVHQWLDALFKVMGPKHRSARHHAGGVEQVRRMWGDQAARAAEIHIMRDCDGVVPSEREAQMVSMCGAGVLRRPVSPAGAQSNDVMRVCIHRGAREIGGTCIEVACGKKRIVLDVGLPLSVSDATKATVPDVSGFRSADPELLGVIISHPHQDHYGLVSRLPPGTTYLIGKAAEAILTAAAVFTGSQCSFGRPIHLEDRTPIDLGPFRITPYLVDHSAFDSYAIMIEAAGTRLFYTGDLRAHGRKSGLFDKLIRNPPAGVRALMMEGTTLGREGTDEGPTTEAALENHLATVFKQTTGMPLVWSSGQNIDRIVTVFRACKRSGRQFIIDMYTAHVLRATGSRRIPQADWDSIRVYLPRNQKRRIVEEKAFDVAALYRARRIFPEDLPAAAAARSVMLFRPGMMTELEKAECLDGACVVYSMWSGYLREARMQPFQDWLKRRGLPMHVCHTSGHASVRDLQRLRTAFSGAYVVPVHSDVPGDYARHFQDVRMHLDGEWWDV